MLRILALAAAAALLPVAASADPAGTTPAPAAAPAATADLVDTAVAAGQFTTLATLLTEAGLVDALKAGEFTVFAPTDEAFAALPGEAVANLRNPENRAQLIAVLTYHVVPGRVPSSAIPAAGAQPTTLQGTPLNITVADGKVKIGEATVVQADVAASNGVIHVIDRVLMPATPGAQ